MALTVSLTGDWMQSTGSQRSTVGSITFDSSYNSGGESLVPGDVGLGAISFIEFNETSGYVFQYDYTAQKVKVYQSAGFTPAGTNSKPTFTVTKGAILASSELGLSADSTSATVNNNTIAATRVLGTNSPVSAPSFTGTAVTAAALTEVTASTDLSSLVVKFRAVGY